MKYLQKIKGSLPAAGKVVTTAGVLFFPKEGEQSEEYTITEYKIERNEWGNTGHVDADGLRELGWNQNDIDWLQKVCWWDAEDDDKWKVSDANKEFGPNGSTPITYQNCNNFKNEKELVFFPKLSKLPSMMYFLAPIHAIPTDGIELDDVPYLLFDFYCLRSYGNLKNVKINNPNSITVGNYLRHCGDTKTWTIKQSIFPVILNRYIKEFDTTNWDFSSYISLESKFSNLYSLRKIINMENWDLSNCISLKNAFTGNYLLKIPNLNNWNVLNITNMSDMFSYCGELTDASWFGDWVLNDNVDLFVPFRGSGITTITFPEIKSTMLNVTDYLFYGMNKLRNIINCKKKISISIKTHYSSILTRESCLVLFNALDPDNPGTITLHANVKARLTNEDKAIATNKGWTIA